MAEDRPPGDSPPPAVGRRLERIDQRWRTLWRFQWIAAELSRSSCPQRWDFNSDFQLQWSWLRKNPPSFWICDISAIPKIFEFIFDISTHSDVMIVYWLSHWSVFQVKMAYTIVGSEFWIVPVATGSAGPKEVAIADLASSWLSMRPSFKPKPKSHQPNNSSTRGRGRRKKVNIPSHIRFDQFFQIIECHI